MCLMKGTISTPMTPFSNRETIAPEVIADHLQWSSLNGVRGIFVLGTWGGFPLLSFAERRIIGETYCRAARNSGIGCVVNVGTPCIHEAETLAREASDAGATAMASLVPYYHSAGGYYRLDDYRRYFERLRKASDLPLFIYNNPRTTGVLLSPADCVTLIEDGVSGVKDGSRDVGWIMATQSLLAEKGLNAELVPGNTTAVLYARCYGLAAVTSGAAVVFPRLMADIFDALDERRTERATALHALLINTRRIISSYGNPAQVSHALLDAMRVPGLGAPRLPWTTLPSAQAARLLEEIRRLEGIEQYLE